MDHSPTRRQELEWSRIRDHRCPQCGARVKDKGSYVRCTECLFAITNGIYCQGEGWCCQLKETLTPYPSEKSLPFGRGTEMMIEPDDGIKARAGCSRSTAGASRDSQQVGGADTMTPEQAMARDVLATEVEKANKLALHLTDLLNKSEAENERLGNEVYRLKLGIRQTLANYDWPNGPLPDVGRMLQEDILREPTP